MKNTNLALIILSILSSALFSACITHSTTGAYLKNNYHHHYDQRNYFNIAINDQTSTGLRVSTKHIGGESSVSQTTDAPENFLEIDNIRETIHYNQMEYPFTLEGTFKATDSGLE